MKRYLRYRLFALIYIFFDYVAIIAAQEVALSVRVNFMSDILGVLPLKWSVPAVYEYLVIPLIFIFFCYAERLYLKRQLFWEMSARIFRASIYTCFVWLLLFFVTQDIVQLSRPYFIILWLVALPVVLLMRYVAKKTMMALHIWQIDTLLIGNCAAVTKFALTINRNPGIGYNIKACLLDKSSDAGALINNVPVLGYIEDCVKILKKENFQEVIIASGRMAPEKLAGIVYVTQPLVQNVSFAPDSMGIPVMGMETATLVNEKICLLRVRNNLAEKLNRLQKQVLDVFCATIGLLVFVPLFIVLSVLIYLDSPGKILFSHERVGRCGKKFLCYKFRTMQPDASDRLKKYLATNPAAAAEWEQDYKLKNDPRVTRAGRFLRRTSLDELPQFINVLKGDMSIVGPRPIVEAEISKYREYISDYYLVRPGITGWWQVYGRNDVSYDDRVQMDSWYVRNWSIWLDIELMFKTLTVMWTGRGAY